MPRIASEIWLNPLGAVALAGPGGNNLYYKGLLDKLGVTANVYRVGTYKAAVEPFTRTRHVPEARANATALAGAMLETWRDDVVRARPAAARIGRQLSSRPGGDGPRRGRRFRPRGAREQAGRPRRRAPRFESRLAELGGKADDDAVPYKQIKLKDYVREVDPGGDNGPIGIVTVAGTIVDGKAGPGTRGRRQHRRS